MHALSSTVEPTNDAGGAVLMLLHFTREVFFVRHGVRARAHLRPPTAPRPGVRSGAGRFLLVGVPYVVWSVVYYLVNVRIAPQEGQWWRELGFDPDHRSGVVPAVLPARVVAGLPAAPLLLRLLRRTAGKHLWLLGGSLVVQLVVLELIQATRGAAALGGGDPGPRGRDVPDLPAVPARRPPCSPGTCRESSRCSRHTAA